jgi:hypothetical protein
MEERHMKLRMIMGILLAGSLFVGTAIQAQDGQDVAEELTAQALPGSIRSVSVECNGSCADSDLGELCDLAGEGFEPIAVDCVDVDDDNLSDTEEACPGGGNNRCNVATLSRTGALSALCTDVDGWDAIVYCTQP